MKFHSIAVENLNSLYGRHAIDFEEDVRNAPLFLIIGPTGAGKSTLLDGVSLALFGVTPRLEQQRGAADTDVGHIMSIGTASCSAELVFSVRNNDGSRYRYRATWSCRRAHDKPDGALQRPERALSVWRDGDWDLVVSDSRNKIFEEPFREALRGLTVDDFRRTILLAQGDFAALLHAGDDEKAAILERLTSTELYQEIGARAASRRREAERHYMSLKGELEQTELLDDDQRDALEAEIAHVAEMVTDADAVLAAVDSELERGRTWKQREAAIDETTAQLEKARDALVSLAPELERLEHDRALRHLEGPFRRLVAAEQAFVTASEKARQAEEALGAIAEEWVAAQKARVEAEEASADVAKRWRAVEPRLEQAAEIEAQLVPARRELETAEQAEATAKDAHEKALATVARAERDLEAARAARDAQKRKVDTAPRVDREHLAARLEAHVETHLDQAWSQLSSLKREAESSDAVNLSALRSRKTRTQNLLLEVAADLDDLDGLALALEADVKSLREQRDALTEATYSMKTLQEREDEKTRSSEQIDKLSRELEALQKERDAARELQAERLERVETLREALALAEQVIALSDLRDALEDGEPCPLCGSPLHPYCMSDEVGDQEAREKRDDLKGRLAVANEAVAESDDKLRRADAALTSKRAALQHQEGLRVEIVEKLEAETKRFTDAAEKGGFPPLQVWELRQGTVLEEALAKAANELADREERLRKLRARRTDWETARDELRAAERDQADAETRASLRADAESAWATRLAEFDGILAPLGLEPAKLETWDDVVSRAGAAHAALQKLKEQSDALDAANEAVSTAQTAYDKANGELKRAAEARDTSIQEVARRKGNVSELEKKLAEILPEGDPAELRKTRQQQLDDAASKLDTARKAAEQVKSEHDQRAGRLRERQKQLADVTTELKDVREAWAEATRGGDVGREDVEAGLLDVETRTKLEDRVKTARQAEERAIGARDAAREALKAFRDENGEPARTLEAVEDERATVASWRDAFAQQRGALRERREQDDRRRASVADQQEELARRRADYQRWRTIAQLIGTGDGAAFRTFAQSLNLQGLVDRANVRLQHLAPRYELAVARGEQGEPTLNFTVRDAFRAGHERPLTTLSGGETFLVSLALALALSDYRRIELPVETLLLDEGFGTLDQDALHMAVDTLQRLHQDSTRQVGIISHVEALKEMVDARIVVEKKGNGRSELRFEVGGLPRPSSAIADHGAAAGGE